ncbi:MAG: hypothetical protein ACPG5B_01700 [Chitinophagales bacterium]
MKIKTCISIVTLFFSTICFGQKTDTISIGNSPQPQYKTIIVDGKETRELIEPKQEEKPSKINTLVPSNNKINTYQDIGKPMPYIMDDGKKSETTALAKVEKGEFISKYDLHALLKNDLVRKGLANWVLSERDSSFIIARKNIVVIEKMSDFKPQSSEAANRSWAFRNFTPLPYEIKLKFTYFSTSKYIQEGKELFLDKLEAIQKQYEVNNIQTSDDTGLYIANSRDEKNRLAKYFLAKAHIENETVESEMPKYYVENNSVSIERNDEYFKIFPSETDTEILKIEQLIKTILETYRPN